MLERDKDHPVIDPFREDQLHLLLPYLEERRYQSGAAIMRQGDRSDTFHSIQSGQVNVYVERETKVQLAVLTKGHFIGELSCLTGEPSEATAEAADEVSTLSVSREGLLVLMESHAAFRAHMLEAMAKRMRSAKPMGKSERTAAFGWSKQAGAHEPFPSGELMGQSMRIRKVRDDIVRCAMLQGAVGIVGEDGVGKSRAASAIHALGSSPGAPLLHVQAEDFCNDVWEASLRVAQGGTLILQHAELLPDEVLAHIAAAGAEARVIMTATRLPPLPAVQSIEMPPLRERMEDIPDLVRHFLRQAGVARPDEAISQEALRLLRLFPFLMGNVMELKRIIEEAFIRSGGGMIHNAHLRLGRYRKPGARPTIGLALGSGTVRGTAHVGVLKVLEQENIAVDYIAGTSAGAFMGALYAAGQPISEFERVLPTVRWRQLVKPILPPVAFVDNGPMARFIEKYIGKIHFEDLPIPFAAVAANAITGEAHILRAGRVSRAICASTAIPGFIKPVHYQGQVLMDGGIVHPVPAALVRSMGADIVIAVDVNFPSFTKGPPRNFITSIMNTIQIMSEKLVHEELQLADVVIKPQLALSPYQFRNAPKFIQVGEQAARQALPAIRQAIAAFERGRD